MSETTEYRVSSSFISIRSMNIMMIILLLWKLQWLFCHYIPKYQHDYHNATFIIVIIINKSYSYNEK